MNAFRELKDRLAYEGYRCIEEDIDAATGDSYMIFEQDNPEEPENTRRYKVTIEEV